LYEDEEHFNPSKVWFKLPQDPRVSLIIEYFNPSKVWFKRGHKMKKKRRNLNFNPSKVWFKLRSSAPPSASSK